MDPAGRHDERVVSITAESGLWSICLIQWRCGEKQWTFGRLLHTTGSVKGCGVTVSYFVIHSNIVHSHRNTLNLHHSLLIVILVFGPSVN